MDTLGIIVCIGLLRLPISILLVLLAIASMKNQERAEKKSITWCSSFHVWPSKRLCGVSRRPA